MFCAFVYSLTVPTPDAITTPSRTTPLYAGTSVTLSCSMTLHPNVDSVQSVWMMWFVASSLPKDQYSDTGLHTSGKTYTRNITISPLPTRHSGRYVCSVIVTGRNAQQVAIDITVRRKLSV